MKFYTDDDMSFKELYTHLSTYLELARVVLLRYSASLGLLTVIIISAILVMQLASVHISKEKIRKISLFSTAIKSYFDMYFGTYRISGTEKSLLTEYKWTKAEIARFKYRIVSFRSPNMLFSKSDLCRHASGTAKTSSKSFIIWRAQFYAAYDSAMWTRSSGAYFLSQVFFNESQRWLSEQITIAADSIRVWNKRCYFQTAGADIFSLLTSLEAKWDSSKDMIRVKCPWGLVSIEEVDMNGEDVCLVSIESPTMKPVVHGFCRTLKLSTWEDNSLMKPDFLERELQSSVRAVHISNRTITNIYYTLRRSIGDMIFSKDAVIDPHARMPDKTLSETFALITFILQPYRLKKEILDMPDSMKAYYKSKGILTDRLTRTRITSQEVDRTQNHDSNSPNLRTAQESDTFSSDSLKVELRTQHQQEIIANKERGLRNVLRKKLSRPSIFSVPKGKKTTTYSIQGRIHLKKDASESNLDHDSIPLLEDFESDPKKSPKVYTRRMDDIYCQRRSVANIGLLLQKAEVYDDRLDRWLESDRKFFVG